MFKLQNVIRMKKILSTLLVAIFASLVHAQITGEFMGLTMGISSMEDAIEVLEEEWIEYEVDDSSSSIHFEHDVELEGYEAEEGFMMFFNDQLVMLMVMITVNLGVMNLLPIPALDGGHLLIYAVEVIRRKPLSEKLEGTINAVGLLLMLALAVLIAIKDIITL